MSATNSKKNNALPEPLPERHPRTTLKENSQKRHSNQPRHHETPSTTPIHLPLHPLPTHNTAPNNPQIRNRLRITRQNIRHQNIRKPSLVIRRQPADTDSPQRAPEPRPSATRQVGNRQRERERDVEQVGRREESVGQEGVAGYREGERQGEEEG